MPKWASRSIGLVIFFLVAFFVGKSIYAQFIKIEWLRIHINAGFLILAFLLEIAARMWVGMLYGETLNLLGTRMPFRTSLSVCWISLLGRYVPGKIAILGSAIYMLSLHKVKPAVAATAPVIANIITIWVAISLSIPYIVSYNDGRNLMALGISVLILVSGLFFFFFPRFLIMPCNLILKRLEYPQILNKLSSRHLIPAITNAVFQCVCAGASTWSFTRAICPIEPSHIPIVISITSLAGSLGLLALFSPAGIGVREGVYLIALSPIVGSEMAALTAVAIRGLQTLCDILTGGIGWILWQHQWPIRSQQGGY
jgi:glycosyltransferase 2 family protein